GEGRNGEARRHGCPVWPGRSMRAMNNTPPQISEVIGRIRWMRLALLPPYCHDGDESERPEADYQNFYREHLDEAVLAADGYAAPIAQFSSDESNPTSVQQLLEARERFIRSFPFCEDELQIEPIQERAALEEWMLATYRKNDQAIGQLIQTLSEYRHLL